MTSKVPKTKNPLKNITHATSHNAPALLQVDAVADDIITLLNASKREQFLLVGTDTHLIEQCIDSVISRGKHCMKYETVYVTTKKDTNPKKKIFIIDLNLKTSMQYQSLLYYYLELPLKNDCYVCLTSTNVQCLNTFEKRVKSRFKHKIFVLGFSQEVDIREGDTEKEGDNNEDIREGDIIEDTKENTDNKSPLHPPGVSDNRVYKQYFKHKSLLQDKYMHEFHMKHSLPFYSIEFICGILEPLHFMLLLICIRQSIKPKSSGIFEIFKKFSVKELKNCDQMDVTYAWYDLLEHKWINSSGEVLIDRGELYEYIKRECPQYLKSYIEE